MSEKKIWSIDQVYLDQFDNTLNWDPRDTIVATEEEVKDLLETDWNPKCIKDPRGEGVYREIEATELTLRTIDDLKKMLKERGYPVG